MSSSSKEDEIEDEFSGIAEDYPSMSMHTYHSFDNNTNNNRNDGSNIQEFSQEDGEELMNPNTLQLIQQQMSVGDNGEDEKKQKKRSRQIRLFSIMISLGRFVDPGNRDYINGWNSDEHLRDQVMPLLRDFFCRTIDDRLRFVDGVMQLEETTSTTVSATSLRNIHIQGSAKTNKKITLYGIRKAFNSNFNNTAPFRIFQAADIRTITKSAFEHAMKYCSKSETRVYGPWYFSTHEGYTGKDIIQISKMWKWQKELVNLFLSSTARFKAGDFDTRRVLLFVDIEGSVGKSSVAKYLDYHGIASVYTYLTVRDALYLISKDEPKAAYCFDLARSRPNDVTFQEVCCVMEALKNGIVISTKYKPRKRLQLPSLVAAFANFYPSKEQLASMSRDR